MKEENKRFAAFGIEEMLKSKHFSISAVDRAAKLMGHTPSGDAYDKLRTLHCVDFGDIPDDIFRRLPSLLNEALSGRRLSAVDIPCLVEGNKELPMIEDEQFLLPPKR